MVTVPTTIPDLINRWPSARIFAAEIECGHENALQMKKRNRIAAHHWSRVISAAEARGIPGINYGWLAARYPKPQRSAA